MGISLPAIALVVITLLNDFVSVSVAYDNTNASPEPSRWHLRRMAGLAVVLGSVATAGVIGSAFMFTEVGRVPVLGAGAALNHSVNGLVGRESVYLNGTNVFGMPFDPRCFYAPSEAFIIEEKVLAGNATASELGPKLLEEGQIICNPVRFILIFYLFSFFLYFCFFFSFFIFSRFFFLSFS